MTMAEIIQTAIERCCEFLALRGLAAKARDELELEQWMALHGTLMNLIKAAASVDAEAYHKATAAWYALRAGVFGYGSG